MYPVYMYWYYKRSRNVYTSHALPEPMHRRIRRLTDCDLTEECFETTPLQFVDNNGRSASNVQRCRVRSRPYVDQQQEDSR